MVNADDPKYIFLVRRLEAFFNMLQQLVGVFMVA